MIAVIDVSGNNLSSLTNALQRLEIDFALTHDAKAIHKASRVILPGVGAAATGMQALQTAGLISVLQDCTRPLLGICLGMQLLLQSSEEGEVQGLGLIPGRIKHLPKSMDYPVPHMGWNQLHWLRPSNLQQGIRPADYVYFVHSYALIEDNQYRLAECDYGGKFSAIIQKDHIVGMQFHPEKSGPVGLQLLKNFCTAEVSC